jgi:predicted MFS family arabinose efflux permease
MSTDPHWLVAWRAMTGVGAAAWVAFTVLFSGYFPPEKAARAMSQVTFISATGQMVSTYVGGLIAQTWGWSAPFYVAVLLALLGAAAAGGLEEKPVAAKRELTLRELWRIGTLPLLLAVSVVAMLGSWTQWATVNGFTPVYAAGLGANRADLGLLTTLMQVGYTLATLLSGFMAERVGARWTAMAGMGIQAAGAFMVPMVGSLPLVGVTQVMGGAGRGLAYPLLMGLSIRSVKPTDRATAMGVFQATYALGMFAGPTSTGMIGDAMGLTAVFVVAGMASLLGMMVVAGAVPERND